MYNSTPPNIEDDIEYRRDDDDCEVIREAQIEDSPIVLPNWLKNPFQSRTNAESENS